MEAIYILKIIMVFLLILSMIININSIGKIKKPLTHLEVIVSIILLSIVIYLILN